MRSDIPVQEQPARNVVTVGASCVNPMQKPVADASRSARPAFSFIKHSTRSLRTGSVGSEKELETTTHLIKWPASALRSLSPELSLWMRFPIVTITLTNVLPVAIVVAV
jgi:hypothetical protein